MSKTPTAEEFLRALPPVLRNDSRMIALGQVVAEELSDRMSEIEKAAIYPRIDELDEALLDILAYDFKVDWYGYDYPLETKRALLKSSFYIHRHLGTKGAVEAAIQSVYPKSIVEEWFDYVEGGNPYTFRIVLDASTHAVPVNNTDLLRAVNLYKSLRSHGRIHRTVPGVYHQRAGSGRDLHLQVSEHRAEWPCVQSARR